LAEELQIRTYGDAALPTLVYLPGLHGDWTLVTGFRLALANQARFVQITYPRSLTWSIEDYANTIDAELLSRGITHGWLLGESFGSQIAWALLGKSISATGPREKMFSVDGLILAGGFVKHPWKWGPGILRAIGRMAPMWLYGFTLRLYAGYSRFRHRNSPELLDTINEFVDRRTALDREAMRCRLGLLAQFDPRQIARQTKVPVYYIAGLVDPLVPFVLVRRWLRKNCPGYRRGKTFWLADHNVLATVPTGTARVILQWIGDHPCQ